MKFATVLSSGVFAAAAANAIAQPSQVGCSCTGSCSIVGDPHVRNWYGETYVATQSQLDIFKSDAVHIYSNVTRENYFMTSIHFDVAGGKSQIIQATDCDKGLPQSTFTAKGVVMTVACNKPKDSTRGKAWHLDMTELSITDNSGLSALGRLSGVCVTHKPKNVQTPSDVDTVNFPPLPEMKCQCSAHCQVFGDPHLESFYDKKALLKAGKSIDIYDVGGFSIRAGVDANLYMNTITVTTSSKEKQAQTSQTYKVSDCQAIKERNLRSEPESETAIGATPGGKLLGTFDMDVENGKVHGSVYCQKESQGAKKGSPMLNFKLTKTDWGTTSESDFHNMEIKAKSTGVCTLEK